MALNAPQTITGQWGKSAEPKGGGTSVTRVLRTSLQAPSQQLQVGRLLIGGGPCTHEETASQALLEGPKQRPHDMAGGPQHINSDKPDSIKQEVQSEILTTGFGVSPRRADTCLNTY